METSIAPTCAACVWRRGGPPPLAVDLRTAPIHMPEQAISRVWGLASGLVASGGGCRRRQQHLAALQWVLRCSPRLAASAEPC